MEADTGGADHTFVPLDSAAVRVLGSLVEKESTTPDNYPLTLNALVAACNQTSNRDPVFSLDEATVARTLQELSKRSLVREVYRSDSRAKRYRHLLVDTLHLHSAETAVLCVLMLRGAQTTGEIRTRTSRLFDFRDLAHVDVTLQALTTLPTPLVARLPRRPGQKEVRYAHLLSGEPQVDTLDAEAQATTRTEPEGEPAAGLRIDALEEEVASLRAELREMREQFEEFRRQFQ